MKRIILHWTAGTYYPNPHDLECYHFLVDKDGNIYNGKFKPEDNIICKSGEYAAHTGGGNTGSIGIAMCAMANFKNKNETGSYPVTLKQFEAAMELCANLAEKYDITVPPDNIITHYEFGLKHPKTSSAGKIDIIYLPPYPWVAQNDIGAFIRYKIKWYRQRRTSA